MRHPLKILAAAAVVLAASVAVPTSAASAAARPAAPAATDPYGDPDLVSMFDGSDLDGWTQAAAGEWSAVGGTIHGNGTARGWIYYNVKQAGTFRWIFNVRQVSGNHAPTVLIWGTTAPLRDALSAIQFQPPNGGHWDYRPGHNNGGGKEFTQLPHTKIPTSSWAQCEIIANQSAGVARMACCPLAAGAATCKAVEVLDFKDPTAGRVGPLAIQVHNAGIHDEYKSLYLESPVVDSPGTFITTE
jgi:3-keto-disaccharide hydrolase